MRQKDEKKLFYQILPGKTNMNTAAKLPSSSITLPIFGNKTAHSNEMENQMVMLIILTFSYAAALTSEYPNERDRSLHRSITAAFPQNDKIG